MPERKSDRPTEPAPPTPERVRRAHESGQRPRVPRGEPTLTKVPATRDDDDKTKPGPTPGQPRRR